jgi:hypothetical protein
LKTNYWWLLWQAFSLRKIKFSAILIFETS